MAGNGAPTPGAATKSRLLVTASKRTTSPDGEAGTLFLTGTQPPNKAHCQLSRPCRIIVASQSSGPRYSRCPRYSQLPHVPPVSPPMSPISSSCRGPEPRWGQATVARVLRSGSALNSRGCSLPLGQQEPDAGKDAWMLIPGKQTAVLLSCNQNLFGKHGVRHTDI